MLVELNLKKNINELHKDKGVLFRTESVDDKDIKRIFKGESIPGHEFWKKHYPEDDDSTVHSVFSAYELSTKGVYCGWNLDNNLGRYFDHKAVEKFAQFSTVNPEYYTSDDIRESFGAEEDVEFLSNGKKMPDFSELIGSYGVADNIDQVLERYELIIAREDVSLIIECSSICKIDQPERDGWRWHKWGQYIGTQVPKHEYLYDEEDIDEVIIFSVIVVEKINDVVEVADEC